MSQDRAEDVRPSILTGAERCHKALPEPRATAASLASGAKTFQTVPSNLGSDGGDLSVHDVVLAAHGVHRSAMLPIVMSSPFMLAS